MNEKDFNLGILLKLYEIAKEVFAKHVIVPDGSYTAKRPIHRLLLEVWQK